MKIHQGRVGEVSNEQLELGNLRLCELVLGIAAFAFRLADLNAKGAKVRGGRKGSGFATVYAVEFAIPKLIITTF
jgi:hypothetical protein